MNLEGTPVLDLAVVAELRASTGDDEAFMAELVDAFITEGATNLDGILAAAAAADAAAVVRPAHSLKSTSASLGAMRLAAVCRAIEEAGREARVDTMAEDAELARATWAATLAAFAEAGLRG